ERHGRGTGRAALAWRGRGTHVGLRSCRVPRGSGAPAPVAPLDPASSDGRGQSSGSAAKSAFASLYQPSDCLGCSQRYFISWRAWRWVSSPALTASLRCLSWAWMTSSAVSPRWPRSQGPPSCWQVMVFIGGSSPEGAADGGAAELLSLCRRAR